MKTSLLIISFFYSLILSAQTAGTLLLQQPDMNKTHITFIYGGDVWVVGIKEQSASRITSTSAVESDPHFSPDGKSIAFTSNRTGDACVYVVSVEGGDPMQKLEGLLAGVDLTRKGLEAMLVRFDVAPLDLVGQPFNPDEMDALTMEASDEVPANHVLREFARGYTFKDRILRHAQVVVSSGPEK